jgi:hypothetical protein
MAMIVQFVMQRLSKNPIWKIPMRIDVGNVVNAYQLDPTLDARKLSELANAEMISLLQAIYPDNL